MDGRYAGRKCFASDFACCYKYILGQAEVATERNNSFIDRRKQIKTSSKTRAKGIS